MPPLITQWFNAFQVNPAMGTVSVPMVFRNRMTTENLTVDNVTHVAKNASVYLSRFRNKPSESDLRITFLGNGGAIVQNRDRYVEVTPFHGYQEAGIEIGFGGPDFFLDFGAAVFLDDCALSFEFKFLCDEKLQKRFLQSRGFAPQNHFFWNNELSHCNLAMQWKEGLQSGSEEELLIEGLDDAGNFTIKKITQYRTHPNIFLNKKGVSCFSSSGIPDLFVGLWDYLKLACDPTLKTETRGFALPLVEVKEVGRRRNYWDIGRKAAVDQKQLNRRIFKPDRLQLWHVLSATQGIDNPTEAWERLESCGLIPSSWLRSKDRVFLHAGIEYEDPPTMDFVINLAADVSGVMTAETLYKEALEKLATWDSAYRKEKIVWEKHDSEKVPMIAAGPVLSLVTEGVTRFRNEPVADYPDYLEFFEDKEAWDFEVYRLLKHIRVGIEQGVTIAGKKMESRQDPGPALFGFSGIANLGYLPTYLQKGILAFRPIELPRLMDE